MRSIDRHRYDTHSCEIAEAIPRSTADRRVCPRATPMSGDTMVIREQRFSFNQVRCRPWAACSTMTFTPSALGLALRCHLLGVLRSASLAVCMIGQGLAAAHGLSPKHAIKQVDRLLSNPMINVDDITCSLGALRRRRTRRHRGGIGLDRFRCRQTSHSSCCPWSPITGVPHTLVWLTRRTSASLKNKPQPLRASWCWCGWPNCCRPTSR